MIKLLTAALLALASATAPAKDGQANRYHVAISADASRAQVTAEVWVEGRELALFNVSPIAGFKNGQADFLEGIEVRAMDGSALALTDKGEGEYEIAQGDRRVKLAYSVRLEHGRHAWPAGAEEVSYRTDEGVMATGYALFLVPGVAMHGPTEVRFDLPAGWRAHTPWRALAGPHSFQAMTRRELVNNALFLGTARAEQIEAGGITLSLVMGKRYWPQRSVFKELIERQLASYRSMFGAAPEAARYLVIINQHHSGDGGAFAGSFSQFLRGDGDRATRPIWGRVVAHELLHFWNGLALAPADGRQEWFKEGVTDYLTVASMAKNGLVDRAYLMQFLENLARGQMVARLGLGLKGSVQDAAKDKHKNWLLVYGGGSVAALALDVELRRATGGKAGLPDLMKALYARPVKTYGHDDIVQAARALSGHDVGPLLARIVQSDAMPDQGATFAQIGLRLEQYPLLETFLLKDPHAGKAMRARFQQLFGMAW